MTKDKKVESNYEKLLDCCYRYDINLNIFMGVINQEISWIEDCIKSYIQGADAARESIIKSKKLIDSMFPVVENILNIEDKTKLLKVVLPNIDAEAAFVNYKIHSSIMGMYNNMANSINLLENCKNDKICTYNQVLQAQETIEQNENTTKEIYDSAKSRYAKVSEKVDIIESNNSVVDTQSRA